MTFQEQRNHEALSYFDNIIREPFHYSTALDLRRVRSLYGPKALVAIRSQISQARCECTETLSVIGGIKIEVSDSVVQLFIEVCRIAPSCGETIYPRRWWDAAGPVLCRVASWGGGAADALTLNHLRIRRTTGGYAIRWIVRSPDYFDFMECVFDRNLLLNSSTNAVFTGAGCQMVDKPERPLVCRDSTPRSIRGKYEVLFGCPCFLSRFIDLAIGESDD